jgi:hypothetical protein
MRGNITYQLASLSYSFMSMKVVYARLNFNRSASLVCSIGCLAYLALSTSGTKPVPYTILLRGNIVHVFPAKYLISDRFRATHH